MSRGNCCAAKGLRHGGYQPFISCPPSPSLLVLLSFAHFRLRTGPLVGARLRLPLTPIIRLHGDSIGHRFLLVLRAEIRGDECSNRFESGHPCGAQ
jgi:hypothetical protein